MRLRRFNSAGIAKFERYLEELRACPETPAPTAILTDDTATEVLNGYVDEGMKFPTRAAAGEFFFKQFQGRDVDRDAGLWAWLSLLYFDQICPVAGGGGTLHESARYLPDLSHRRVYRHPLLGPFLIVRAVGGNAARARIVLLGPLHVLGELPAQLAARYAILANPMLFELADILYFNPATGVPKRGAGGSGPGSPRRLTDVLDQLAVNWELGIISAEAAIKKLPAEFDRFLTAKRTGAN